MSTKQSSRLDHVNDLFVESVKRIEWVSCELILSVVDKSAVKLYVMQLARTSKKLPRTRLLVSLATETNDTCNTSPQNRMPAMEEISNVWFAWDGIVNWFSETLWGRRSSEKKMKKFLPCLTRFKLRTVSCRLSKLNRSRWELNLWTFAGVCRTLNAFHRQTCSLVQPRSLPTNFFPMRTFFFGYPIRFHSVLNENHEDLIPKHVWEAEKNLSINIHTK